MLAGASVALDLRGDEHDPGQRPAPGEDVAMSCQTAPVGLVMTAIVVGRVGSGRLRAPSNRPSAASRALSASNRSARSPKPAGWIDST